MHTVAITRSGGDAAVALFFHAAAWKRAPSRARDRFPLCINRSISAIKVPHEQLNGLFCLSRQGTLNIGELFPSDRGQAY